MKLKSAFFALSVLSISQAFGAMSDKQLGDALRKDISNYIYTTKTPRLIFHWADASDITPKGKFQSSFPGNDPMFRDYVAKQGAKIYRPRRAGDSDIEGPGLYLSSDPIDTRHYGGEKNFGLIIGLIKPGAKIIPNNRQLYVSPALVSEIQARGCSQASTYPQILDSFTPECTKIKQLLVGQDISFADGRMYAYGHANIPGCKTRNHYRELSIPSSKISSYDGVDTFVGFNANLFSEVVGITHKTAPGSHKLTNEILSYLKGLQVNLNTLKLISDEQLKNASIKPMSAAEVAKFSQTFIMGCNK